MRARLLAATCCRRALGFTTAIACAQLAQHSQGHRLSLGHVAMAEASPQEFFKPTVVLTLKGAQQVLAAAVAEADANSWAVTIAVTDAAGVPLVLERHGSAPMTVDIAIGKARTAAMSGKETTVFERIANGSDEQRPRLALLSAPLLLMEGGVPIVVDGVIVGAVGVSGVRSDQDAQIAKAGLAALS